MLIGPSFLWLSFIPLIQPISKAYITLGVTTALLLKFGDHYNPEGDEEQEYVEFAEQKMREILAFERKMAEVSMNYSLLLSGIIKQGLDKVYSRSHSISNCMVDYIHHLGIHKAKQIVVLPSTDQP